MDGGSSTSGWLSRGLLLFAPAVLGILFLGLAAAAEMAFASLNRNELRRMAAGQRRIGKLAEMLLSEPARLLSTLMVTKVLASTAVIVGATLLAREFGGSRWLGWWLAGAVTLILLVQILSRAWVVNKEERAAVALAPLVRALALLLSPVTALLRRIGGGAVPKGAAPESVFLSEDGLRFLLHVTDEEAVIEDEEKEMIASIFEFSDTLVREVMVPRMDVTSVSCDAPMLEALEVILKAGHSRIPIYTRLRRQHPGCPLRQRPPEVPARRPDRHAAQPGRRVRPTSSRNRKRWTSSSRNCSSAGYTSLS